jgi:hypothetical protein
VKSGGKTGKKRQNGFRLVESLAVGGPTATANPKVGAPLRFRSRRKFALLLPLAGLETIPKPPNRLAPKFFQKGILA